MLRRSSQGVARLALMIAMLACANTSASADFTFAAFGDTPYTEEEESRFVGMIAELNREKLAFVIHVGDFKSGWSPCSDALFKQRAEWFALFHHALIYTPGDNEWTDCWRAWPTQHEPLERLQKLRGLFFADNHSLGQHRLTLARQNGGYPEHARWTHEGITFATLNVPGGDNNLRMPDEAAARGKMLEAWVIAAFDAARAQGHRAVVLAMQANPFLRSSAAQQGYAGLLNTLLAQTQNYSGEVLLIHGDTHRYRVDQPLADRKTRRTVRNFTRLEVFGYPFMNWVRVQVSHRNGRIVFTPSPGM